MTCFKPLKAYRSKDGITFESSKSLVPGSSFYVPCGRCTGCRLARAEQWATRCLHESKVYQHNEFVTLTYDPKYYPEDGSVNVQHVQLFMRYLRRKYNQRIRFFCGAEYGDVGWKAHYHLLLFNINFDDKKVFTNVNSKPVFTSEILSKIWSKGFCTTAPVNAGTAGYVARYAMKKITGDREREDDRYCRPHPFTGKLVYLKKEFCVMSRRPGIGTEWFNNFRDDCYPSDFLVVDGKKKGIPRFYDDKIKKEQDLNPVPNRSMYSLVKIKRARKASANKRRSDATPERLAVREELLKLKLERKTRVLGDYS